MKMRACLVLIAALSPVSLFAGVTMVTQTTRPGCDFRVDKCNTWVSTDPSYFTFQDGIFIHTAPLQGGVGDPTLYNAAFGFKDYGPLHSETVADLLADIRSKLSNCPEVTLAFDEESGEITVHYLKTDCADCDCDFTINIRDVKATDFVWTRTSDNYSPRLGQMELRKFHAMNQKDAQDIQTDLSKIVTINNWSMTTR
jgi:hypothetical protein